MGSEEQIQAQAAVVLTLVDSTVRCTVLKGSLTELNDQADDLANLLVSVANSGEPPFKEDARIAALTEELERAKEERAAIRAAFERKSNDPEVSAVVQAAFGCVVFAFDYPDKLVDNYRKEPR